MNDLLIFELNKTCVHMMEENNKIIINHKHQIFLIKRELYTV